MPSRRDSIKLSEDEIRDYLATQRTVIVVSNGKDGFPHPMPMWFYVDGEGRINCTTFGKSQKVLNLQRDPRATLLVETGFEYAELKGLVIYAHGDVIEDADLVTDTLARIQVKHRSGSEEDVEAMRNAVAASATKRVLLRFTPERYVSWDHSRLRGRY
jgi:hypothetical protein